MSSTSTASTTVTTMAVVRTGRRRLAAGAALLAAGLLATTGGTATAAPAATRAGGPTRVTTGLGGAQPDGAAWAESLSADGRYAVIGADATNLVPGDTNGGTDVFVRDLATGRTERVSLTSSGAQADGRSYDGSISGNGHYVVFTSTAALVPGDTNGAEDIYLRDRWTGRTERLTTGDPKREVPDLNSYLASISRDGRYVAFASSRTDLVPGTVNQLANVYLLDRWSGSTRLVTRAADGTPADRPSAAPVISGDGSRVGFVSKATNLLPPEEGGGEGRSGEGGGEGGAGEAARTADAAAASTDDHVPGRPARKESSPPGPPPEPARRSPSRATTRSTCTTSPPGSSRAAAWTRPASCSAPPTAPSAPTAATRCSRSPCRTLPTAPAGSATSRSSSATCGRAPSAASPPACPAP